MNEANKLFNKVIRSLHDNDILENLIVIGSWCLYYYRIYFDETRHISPVRTLDLDLMIPNPPEIDKDVDLTAILENQSFDLKFGYNTGYVKYVNPALTVEFLTPMLGRGKSGPYEIKELHVNAQGLRFLNFLQQYTMKIKDGDIEVTVPEPSAFVLHKFIISQRRKNKAKAERDITAAKELGEYLLTIDEQKEKMIRIFKDVPEKWQDKIVSGVKGNSEELHKLLTSI